MPLEPATAAMLEQLAAAGGPSIDEMAPADARAMYRALQPLPEDLPVGSVENRSVPGPGGPVPVRIYRPEGAGPFPLHLQFHGGGWVIGDLDTHDGDCRELCRLANVMVIAVDYRLAPEHPYPAAAEDCYAVTAWAHANAAELGARPGPWSVGGDSAGGNLAAVVSLMAKEQVAGEFGVPEINLQLLIYPVTDAAMETVSYRDNGDGYMLTAQGMRWFWDQYCPEPSTRFEAWASPMQAPDLGGLPPAHVMTAEFDPLRDEGEAYARRLEEAGVAVECTRYPGLIHGFFSQARLIDAARPAVEAAAGALRAAHG